MSNANDSTPHSETSPALVDPPAGPPKPHSQPIVPSHPDTHPCAGCPRWQRTTNIVLTDSVIFWRGVNLGATMGEVRIITKLVNARGEHVPYRDIYDTLKGIPGFRAGYGDDGFHTNVRSCIKRIRKKFLAIDPTFKSIENLQAYGYAWRRE
jgi:two-component system, OmpR family, response regulator ChvI